MASGFSVVDFMDLPAVERCIVRLILRETTMSYSELLDMVTTLPDDQEMDQSTFDSALNHLTRSDWLICQTYGQQTTYRVNTLWKTTGQKQGLLDGIDLETLEAPSLRLNLETSDLALSANRGKRVLPSHIWDCLTKPVTDEPVSEAPKRRSSIFDRFVDDESSSKNK